METKDDKTDVELARQGDAAAFGRLITGYQKKVFGFILGQVRNPQTADELTQAAFVKAWKALPQFRGESSFQTWLFQIALNGVRSWARWQKLRWFHETSLSAAPADAEEDAPTRADRIADARSDAEPGRQIETADVQRRVQAAIATLPPKEKMVFQLRHFEDLPLKEIAAVMGIAEGSVKAHLFHALEKLRKALPENDHEL